MYAPSNESNTLNEQARWMEAGDPVFGRFFAATSPRKDDFQQEFIALIDEYEMRAGSDLSREFLLRFHVSDIAGQEEELRALLKPRSSFVSIIGQPPANGSRIGMEAWHMPAGTIYQCGNHNNVRQVRADMGEYKLLLLSFLSSCGKNSREQMLREWESLAEELASLGGNIAHDVHRTWIYCRDIDNNYPGLVDSRNIWFARNGLTPETHFIASTGIEGQNAVVSRLVMMDSLAVLGLDPRQIQYMNAPDYLSPTHIYGVSFERGARLVFGDGSLYFISGTASIDNKGNIVHPGDIRSQVRRTIENIEALMKQSEGSIQDLKLACVYLRDAADAALVERELAESPISSIPRLLLKAPVCRPGWLIEIDAIAANREACPDFLPFSPSR